MTKDLAGMKVLITAGALREDIDGVRFYANRARRETLGFDVAAELSAQGAVVTTLAPDDFLTSGREFMDAAQAALAKNKFDAVLCMASIASIRPAMRAAQKLKVKDTAKVSMPVVGNVDVEARVKTWGLPALGYNAFQEWFSTNNPLKELEKIAKDVQPEEKGPSLAGMNEIAELDTLRGKVILMTGGPTEEAITTSGDVITNFSSGRQASELANVFAAAGATVIYVTGPAKVLPAQNPNIILKTARSAKDMLAACEAALPADIFVGVAAVADFGCKKPPNLRLAEGEAYTLALDQNPDILSTIGHGKRRPSLVVGFAAETDPAHVLSYAQGKLFSKNADLICANLVGPSLAAQKDINQIFFISRNAEPQETQFVSKSETAREIAKQIASRL